MRHAASRGDALVHERMYEETDYRSTPPCDPRTCRHPATRRRTDARSGMDGSPDASGDRDSAPGVAGLSARIQPSRSEPLRRSRSCRGCKTKRRSSIASSRRCCSQTSSIRPLQLLRLAIEPGATSWSVTMPSSEERSRGFAASRSTPQVTASSRPSTVPARRAMCDVSIDAIRPLGIDDPGRRTHRECQTIDGKVGGIGVVIGARVGSKAAPGEMLVSQTVKDLTAGSGLILEDAGVHELKGVPGALAALPRRVTADGIRKCRHREVPRHQTLGVVANRVSPGLSVEAVPT